MSYSYREQGNAYTALDNRSEGQTAPGVYRRNVFWSFFARCLWVFGTPAELSICQSRCASHLVSCLSEISRDSYCTVKTCLFTLPRFGQSDWLSGLNGTLGIFVFSFWPIVRHTFHSTASTIYILYMYSMYIYAPQTHVYKSQQVTTNTVFSVVLDPFCTAANKLIFCGQLMCETLWSNAWTVSCNSRQMGSNNRKKG